MGTYLGDHPYDLAIAVYDGRGTADEAFDELKALERQGSLKIEEAAVFTRNERGKVKLDNKATSEPGRAAQSDLASGCYWADPSAVPLSAD